MLWGCPTYLPPDQIFEVLKKFSCSIRLMMSLRVPILHKIKANLQMPPLYLTREKGTFSQRRKAASSQMNQLDLIAQQYRARQLSI
jgi:hypothetical protein